MSWSSANLWRDAEGGVLIAILPQKLASISASIEADFIAGGRFPGGHLRILSHGEIIHDSCVGRMDVERNRRWTSDAIVRIYSMTKPVISAALMMQVERGQISLDQPVAEILPGWHDQKVWVSGAGDDMKTEPAARPVTLRDLVTHTAGLTYGTRLAQIGGARVEDPVALLHEETEAKATQGLQAYAEAIGSLPLRFQPGTRWMYSVATDIVGAVVETVAEEPLGTVLEEQIFRPLGMVDTGFQVPGNKASRLAACYIATPDNPMLLVDDPVKSGFLTSPAFESGGGGLLSTMDDYSRFAEMLRVGGSPLLSPTTVAAMTENQLPDGEELKHLALIGDPALVPEGTGFGFGLATTIDELRAGIPATGDYYWSGAATTIWWVDPVRELTVLFLTQLLPATAYDFQNWLKRQVYSAID